MDDQSSLGAMFDSPRGLTSIPSRLRAAVLLSVAAHLALLVMAVSFGRSAPAVATRPGPLNFPRSPGKPGGAPAVTPVSAPPKGRPAPRARPLVRPRTPEAPVPETSTPPPAVASTAPPVGTAGGEGPETSGDDGPAGPGRCAAPPCGGSGLAGEELLSESAVAALPVLLSSSAVRVPASVQAAGGRMTVLCVITTLGTVTDCQVTQGAPLAEAAVLATLRTWTYRPAQLDGRPVGVRHRFIVELGSGR